ncbi:hypothetical protein [Clavibacter nebraskensis]|nr:hypothetical protein [Clavibacter nebraskensis]UKF27077.1 hypothetical protein FGQ65_01850 [Clavibacter nebraskensis]
MEHWEWAELLMLHSDTLRDEIQAALATVREGESRSRAQREGRAAAHRDEAQEATLRDRARAKILELLDSAEDDGWIAGAKLRQRLSKAQREVSDDVIAQLVEQEAIQAEEAGTDNNRGYRYQLSTKVPTD